MRYGTSLMILCAVSMFALLWNVPESPAAIGEPDVEIVMKHRAFKVVKGGGTIGWPTFRLLAGKPSVIKLRNEDDVAHEFVSPMFRDVDLRLVGEATTIWTKKAAGVRVDPGRSVELHFVAPVTEDFSSLYDIFWCNIHGKEHGAEMRGELIVVETRGEIM